MLINEESKPLASCVVCHCEKTVRGIFSHFTKEHTESSAAQKEKAIIARHANNAVYIAAGEKRKLENKAVYDTTPKICLHCSCTIPYAKRHNKFCSQTCSGTYNNTIRDKVSRERQRETVTATYNVMKQAGVTQKICKISFCNVCNKLIKNSHDLVCRQCHEDNLALKLTSCTVCGEKVKRYNRRTCSSVCLHTARMRSGTRGGLASVKKMNGARRSKDEVQLFKLCSEEYSNITANDTSITNGWDADILLHDYKIAVMWNGPWHYRDMPGLKNHSLSQVQNRDRIKIKEFNSVGWKVLVFEDRHYTPQTAFESIKKTINGVTGGS